MHKKLALITGGTSGIGFGVAQKLASSMDLALVYEARVENAEDAQKNLLASRPESVVSLHRFRLQDPEVSTTLIESIVKKHGRPPDIFVHSAGRTYDHLFLASEMQRHRELLQVHLISAMEISQTLLKTMCIHRFGRIILIGSVSARYARRGQVSYSAAKAAQEAFARTLALEVAHRGVTVNVIQAGLIATPLTADLIEERFENEQIRKHIPAGFIGEPQDIAAMVEYLCSDSGRYMTGSVITIDGGKSLGDYRS